MTVDLLELFLARQQELDVKLQGASKATSHPGAKGEAAELNWRGMLSEYLPWRYQITKGFVVDSTGSISEEIDLVLYDRQYSPLLFTQSEIIYVPAESVYAVFEVRQELSRKNIEYAGKKAASVRRLTRTTAPITHAGGIYEPKEPFPILAGLLCRKSSWDPRFGDAFRNSLSALTAEERLDLGCVLRDGGFKIAYSDDAPIIDHSSADTSLVFFFINLLHRLQQVGTIPAIDLMEYGKVLESIRTDK